MYALYIVDSESEFDYSDATAQQVVSEGKKVEEDDTMDVLLFTLVEGLNRGDFGDQDWYFIIDRAKGEIKCC